MAAIDTFVGGPTASDGGGAINMRPVIGVNGTTAPQQGADDVSTEAETGEYLSDQNSLNLMTAELASLIYGNFRGNYRKLMKTNFRSIKFQKKTLDNLKKAKSNQVSHTLSMFSSDYQVNVETLNKYDFETKNSGFENMQALKLPSGNFLANPLHVIESIRSSALKNLLNGNFHIRSKNLLPISDTALHLATKYGEMEKVFIMVNDRDNLNILNKEGKTALDIALDSGHDDIAKLLLIYGADPETIQETSKQLLEQKGITSENGADLIAKLLLIYGADPETIQETSKQLLSDVQFASKKIKIQNTKCFVDSKELSLEDFLDFDVDKITLGRIEELLSNKLVKSRFEYELNARKENLEIFDKVKPFLREIDNYEILTAKAKQKILELKVKAFRESRKLNVKEISYIDSIRQKMKEIHDKIDELCSYKEVATAYRLEKLVNLKKQFDKTGFVRSKSRDDIIEDIQDSILLGKNVLLTGATGTGKTVLAVEAVKEIGKLLNVSFECIDGKKLVSEISSAESKKEFDDFVEVFSGSPDSKASDFIAKQRLKGGIETYTEKGKLLKAFTEGKIPIIDEIDLIPNDTLMRLKHLFTKRSGDYYAPQEDGNSKYLLRTVNIIATANIKSAKHQNREDLDPAIVRLFDNIHVNYLPKEEVYDLALVNIMDKAGFIYKVSLQELQDENSTLARLIYCLKKVEVNYLGIGTGEKISNKDGQFLNKAVLELGRFVGLFNGFASSGLEFSQYIKKEVIGFITNMAYPKSDRLILAKIFSEKGFITNADVGTIAEPGVLLRIMDDISKKELEDNILVDDYKFDADSRIFIDSFELANLDAFGVRNLQDKKLMFTKSEIFGFLNNLDRFLQRSDIDGKDGLEQLINDILSENTAGDNLIFPEDKKMLLVGLMYQLALRDELLVLKKIKGFEVLVTKIILIDSEQKKVFYGRKGDYIPEDMPPAVTEETESNALSELDKKRLEVLKTEIQDQQGITIVEFINPRKSGKNIFYGSVKLDGSIIVPFIDAKAFIKSGSEFVTYCESVEIDSNGYLYGIVEISHNKMLPFITNSSGFNIYTEIGGIKIEKCSNVVMNPQGKFKGNIQGEDGVWHEFEGNDINNIKTTFKDWEVLKNKLQAKYKISIDNSEVEFCDDVNGIMAGSLVLHGTSDMRVPFLGETIIPVFAKSPISDTRNLTFNGNDISGEVLLSDGDWYEFKGINLISMVVPMGETKAYTDWLILKNILQHKYSMDIINEECQIISGKSLFGKLHLADGIKVPFYGDEAYMQFGANSAIDCDKISIDSDGEITGEVKMSNGIWYNFLGHSQLSPLG